jgi:serine/threonine protein kinase
MSLAYPAEWKFEGNGIAIDANTVSEFFGILKKISNGNWDVIEEFKRIVGCEGTSSSYSWALSDLESTLSSNSNNSAIFLESIWNCILYAKSKDLAVPDAQYLNVILEQNKIPLIINPPNLVSYNSTIIQDIGEAQQKDKNCHSYELINIVGKGGFGVVYRATRTTKIGDFQYAIKVLDPMPFGTNYEEAFKRFCREVNIIRELQHKSIVSYFDAGVNQANKPYIVMPLIEGKNLRDAIRENLNVEFGVSLFVEILEALDYSHCKNVIHRDLKPGNIIVRSSDNQPIILDFGCAYILDQMDSQTLTTHLVGTSAYIPSEVIAQPNLRSPLQDIYACGIMLYEAFANHLPDPANYSNLSLIDSQFGILDAVIQSAISGQASRTKSAKDFAIQLKDLLSALRGDSALPTKPSKLQNPLDHFYRSDIASYKQFSESISRGLKKIREDAKIVGTLNEIEESLKELYGELCLEEYVHDIPKLTKCMVSGGIHWQKTEIRVSVIKDFLDLLNHSSPEKREIIYKNLVGKIKTIPTYPNPDDDDLPF